MALASLTILYVIHLLAKETQENGIRPMQYSNLLYIHEKVVAMPH